jgi:predicted metal-dependent hydrolase
VNLKIDVGTGLEVVIPDGTDVDIPALLQEKRRWIQKHLTRIEAATPDRQYVSGETLPFFGEYHALDVMPEVGRKRTTVTHHNHVFTVRFPTIIKQKDQREVVRSALESWYRREAKRYLPPRTEELAAEFGFIFQNIAIRGQKTRWGSCSSKGNLNYNWRLMMAPPDTIDYLIIHELCHLKVPNHSRKFWNMVARFCPDYIVHKNWLKSHSAEYNLL